MLKSYLVIHCVYCVASTSAQFKTYINAVMAIFLENAWIIWVHVFAWFESKFFSLICYDNC